jgi:hypothetical protein
MDAPAYPYISEIYIYMYEELRKVARVESAQQQGHGSGTASGFNGEPSGLQKM